MKKTILTIVALLILFLPLSSNYRWKADFLGTAVAVAKTVTKVNGTDFTSNEIRVGNPGDPNIGTIMLTFTRTTGSALLVDFEFQVSCDGAQTWSTVYYVKLSVATNATAVSNVVRTASSINLYGISHIRLYRIVNNDTAIDLTACNATLTL